MRLQIPTDLEPGTLLQGTCPIPEDWQSKLPSDPTQLRFHARDGEHSVPVQLTPYAWDSSDEPMLARISFPLMPWMGEEVTLEPSGFTYSMQALPTPHADIIPLLTSRPARVVLRDVDGREWQGALAFKLWDHTDQVQVHDQGPWMIYARDAERMVQREGQASDAIMLKPLGLISNATVYHGRAQVNLELAITNGIMHMDPNGDGAVEAQVPHILVDAIWIEAPGEWHGVTALQTLAREVLFNEDDGTSVTRLMIWDRKGGDAGVLRSRDRATYRVTLCAEGDLPQAFSLRRRRNWVTPQVTDWSRYWQATREHCPELGPLAATAKAAWEHRLASVEQALLAGTPYPYQMPQRLGHVHPLGVSIGYMTSGNEVEQCYGTEAVALHSADALLCMELEADMIGARHGGDLYDEDVQLLDVPFFLSPDGQQESRIFSGEFQKNHPTHGFPTRERGTWEGAWSYAKAQRPSFWSQWVGFYSWEGFERHDMQHLVRGYYQQRALMMLLGDAESIEQLQRESLLTQLELDRTPGGRLHTELERMQEHPHQATNYGRAFAHGADVVATAWMVTDVADRVAAQHSMDWAIDMTNLAILAQTKCGAIYGNRDSKTGGYGNFRFRWAICQTWEEAMVQRGLYALCRSMLDGQDHKLAMDCVHTIIRSAAFLVKLMRPGTHGNWEQVAVADRMWPPTDPSPGVIAVLADPERVNGGPSNDQQVGGLFGALIATLYTGQKENTELLVNQLCTYMGQPGGSTWAAALDAIMARGFYAWGKRAGTFGLVQRMTAMELQGAEAELL
jgi:hypothetical protein